MMKKLLILTLVLGMASAANAALTVSAPTEVMPGSTVTISIVSDNTDDACCYLDIYYVSEGLFSLSNPRLTVIAPTLSTQNMYDGVYDNIEIEALFVSAPGVAVTPGVWFEVDLTCLGVGDVKLELYDGAAPYTLLQELTIYQLPEPATLLLLGFGVVMVRRKR
jgi:hypothetical protein